MRALWSLPAMLVPLSLACMAGPTEAPVGTEGCTPAEPGQPGDPIDASSLACMSRHGEPVLRDPFEGEAYEGASDGHVFRDADGTLRMIYSGDVGGASSIKLATGQDPVTWSVTQPLLSGDSPSGLESSRETAFYRLADDGTHQIFYIGYVEAEGYRSQIFLAEADTLLGPWRLPDAPVVPVEPQDGFDTAMMTSPSVVSHEGTLHMVFLAWNAEGEAATDIRVMGALSSDDGRTWTDIRQVDVPVGMEGQLTRGPDGRFYAVAQRSEEGSPETITLAVADAPFGPYETVSDAILTGAGPPYEVDELNTPQLTFDEEERTAYLYYVGSDYQIGWWMMLATARY